MSYNIMIWNGKWKIKNKNQYHLNIHILSQISITLEKDFEKAFWFAEIVAP
jgi:hypothetical protein